MVKTETVWVIIIVLHWQVVHRCDIEEVMRSITVVASCGQAVDCSTLRWFYCASNCGNDD
jgi:hypothetical protein